MADLYASYTALAAAETEGVAYERRTVTVTGATWSSIAIHGGGIEPGSGEVARAVAAGVMAHYEFAGIKAANNSDLHVTSTNFNEPIAQAQVLASRRTLSFHGFTGDGTPVTAIGGLDTVKRDRIAAMLTAAGFTVTTAAQEISGSDPANIANGNAISAGVQIEMSNALRASFFPGGDLSRTMRDSGQRTSTFTAYVAAILKAYSGYGVISQGSINVSRWATVPSPSADVDVAATVSTNVLATGGSHFCALAARFADVNNTYLARVEFSITQAVILTLRKRVASTETLLATYNSPLTHAAGTRFAIRFQVTGSTLQASVSPVGAPEVVPWQATITDTALTAAGSIGTRSILSSTNTNTLPVLASWGDVQVPTPQVFTVIRSVNTVVKGQSAGRDIRLAHPMILSL